MSLSSSLGVACHSQDWTAGAVGRHQVSRPSSCGKNNDGSSHTRERSFNSSNSNGVSGVSEHWGLTTQVFKLLAVEDRRLCLSTDLVHVSNSFQRIVSLSSLARQHDTVSSVQHGISHITRL